LSLTLAKSTRHPGPFGQPAVNVSNPDGGRVGFMDAADTAAGMASAQTGERQMASEQSAVVREWWIAQAEAVRANPGEPISELRDRNEHWGDMTAEPGGVDYLETEVAGFPALWAVPRESRRDRVILALHGGGFVGCSVYTHRKLYAHLAKATGARALITDYRKVPEHRHPAPLEDTTTAYRWLLDQGVEARHVAIAGDSAGAGLALATALHARQLGLPLPAALMLMSAWVDMTVNSDTWESNRDKDPFFKKEVVESLAATFLGGADAKDPLASPLWADLAGLPPMYIQPGADEGLAGESIALAAAARLAGVDTQLDVVPEQLHVFQLAAGWAPEADEAISRLADWAKPLLGLSPARLD
jgi:monoterpene epsilon-lactone hydrolase